MTALFGGMRAMAVNYDGSNHGVFTDRPGVLSTDYFRNVLDLSTKWAATSADEQSFEGRDRTTTALKYTGTRVDLIFGSNSELRSFSEVYASNGAEEKFVNDFVKAWAHVMNADRFDLA